MARNRTLQSLRDQVRWQSDTLGLDSRHSDARIDSALNQSIQRFREKVSAAGITHYLVSTTGTLTAGATAPHPFSVLDLSAVSPAVVRVYGLDVTIDGSRIRDLFCVPFTDRARYQDWRGPSAERPIAYAHFSTAKLAILPPPDGAYPYVCWYLPVLPDLLDDGDEFDGVAGWEEWIVWDVVLKLCNRDQYPQAHGMAMNERELVWRDVQHASASVNRTLVVQRKDTWGEHDRRLREPRLA
ncbi:MAG TPA: hypothetical protein VKY73_21080 [Polyangiaceae bacterium]|nr:hypothetical protein [Polyangiaceae bacterium]